MLERADEREEDSESVSEEEEDADVGEVDDAIVDSVEMYFGSSKRLNSVFLSLWWTPVIGMMLDWELSQTLVRHVRISLPLGRGLWSEGYDCGLRSRDNGNC